jgi:hypothetical protein
MQWLWVVVLFGCLDVGGWSSCLKASSWKSHWEFGGRGEKEEGH